MNGQPRKKYYDNSSYVEPTSYFKKRSPRSVYSPSYDLKAIKALLEEIRDLTRDACKWNHPLPCSNSDSRHDKMVQKSTPFYEKSRVLSSEKEHKREMAGVYEERHRPDGTDSGNEITIDTIS